MFSSVGVKNQDRSDRSPGRYLKTSRRGLFEIPFSGLLFFSCLLILAKADANRLAFVPCVYFYLPPLLPPGLQSSIGFPAVERLRKVTQKQRKERIMKMNIAGDALRYPGGLCTIVRHADSENRNLSKQASISPPTEIISLSVRLTQGNVHTSDRLCCQWGPFPLTFLPLY